MVWACVKIDYKCTGKEDRKLELGKFKKGGEEEQRWLWRQEWKRIWMIRLTNWDMSFKSTRAIKALIAYVQSARRRRKLFVCETHFSLQLKNQFQNIYNTLLQTTWYSYFSINKLKKIYYSCGKHHFSTKLLELEYEEFPKLFSSHFFILKEATIFLTSYSSN